MITINCPKSWAEVSLGEYLEFYRGIKPYIGTEEYVEKIPLFAVFNFTDITEDEYRELPESTLTEIQHTLLTLLTKTDLPLVKSFEVENTKYGFIPSLDDMSYGEYLDLISYTKKDIWSNIPTIMSILYRPITKSLSKSYTVEKYSGTTEEKTMLFTLASDLTDLTDLMDLILKRKN